MLYEKRDASRKRKQMACPNPNDCLKLKKGRCAFLLGTSSTHDGIRKECEAKRAARDAANGEAGGGYDIGLAPSRPNPVRGGL
jgi:hypothetical protein